MKTWIKASIYEKTPRNSGTKSLREPLRQAVVRDQDQDRDMAADWIAVDQESCSRLDEF